MPGSSGQRHIHKLERNAQLLRLGGNLPYQLDRLAGAFAAPAYFGRNWDALDEVLRDLEWLGAPPPGGHLLLVDRAAALWATHGPSGGRLVEAWLAAAESWAAEGVPFHLVFLW